MAATDLEKKLKIAVEALEFYADRGNWKDTECDCMSDRMAFLPDDEDSLPPHGSPWHAGIKARQVLKDIKG